MEVQNQLIQYLQAEHNLCDSEPISVDTPLFTSGRIDSMGMLDLVIYIERRVGVPMKPDDVTIDNLNTVRRIDSYISAEQQ